MKKYFLLSLITGFCTASTAQVYQPDWTSLDQRPVPQWYKDSKFGIFIHWGVYSVPAYCTKGNYAEWYQNGLMNGDTARIKFHKAKFGDRTYYDLASDFKAELFNPDDWARLFEKSGARYIVLTSKHHDGYCLWPSKTANQTWGFKWNAADVGPQRDLLGDLFKAVRKTPVRAGMYFSLYEWFNPLWKKDPAAYALQHAWPQMKDLINAYEPDVFWTDGDWDAPAETWKSQEFLAWLYNESPVKNKVVTYDRWGSGIRFKHGQVYTPEYQPDVDFEDHMWEESRGMGFSYGYNREEDAWDYNSTQSLVIALIDKVSRGGNFLLDIGPDEHGKIPPIMQERLLQIGDWLKLNGESIYNTVRWKKPFQWSDGRTDYKYKNEAATEDWKTGGDVMLKLTVDPDPGYAVKEVFYTYNQNTNTLYAIFPTYPASKKLVLKDLTLPENAVVNFVTGKRRLLWRKEANHTVVELPDYQPDQFRSPYAFVVKIENFGKFASRPKIRIDYPAGSLSPVVTLTSTAPGTTLHYTTDGTEPSLASKAYSNPFRLDRSASLKVASFYPRTADDTSPGMPSATVEEIVKKFDWQPAIKAQKVLPGIRYRYFEPSGKVNLATLTAGAETNKGIAKTITEEVKQRKEKYALLFEGYIWIKQEGIYDFFTRSDDGSKLFIDGQEVVNNDGEHGSIEAGGKAALKKGYHQLRVEYFDSGGGNELKVLWQPPGRSKETIPSTVLFHQ